MFYFNINKFILILLIFPVIFINFSAKFNLQFNQNMLFSVCFLYLLSYSISYSSFFILPKRVFWIWIWFIELSQTSCVLENTKKKSSIRQTVATWLSKTMKLAGLRASTTSYELKTYLRASYAAIDSQFGMLIS